MGIDIVACARARIDIGLAHCDNLFFQANFHAFEGHDAGRALFMFKVRTARQRGDMRPKPGNSLFGSSDCAVDSFFGEQNCAFDALMLTKRHHRRAQSARIVKAGEVIKSGDCKHDLRHNLKLSLLQDT